jgi:hypothetical protein
MLYNYINIDYKRNQMNLSGMNIGGYRLKKGELTIAKLKVKAKNAGIKAPKPVNKMRRIDWLSIRPMSPATKPKPAAKKPVAKKPKPAAKKPVVKKLKSASKPKPTTKPKAFSMF